MTTIELPRRRILNAALFAVGLFFVLVAALFLGDDSKPLAPGAWFLVLGLLLVVVCARRLLAKTPRFRATPDGVWFGGGAVIPWAEVKAVFDTSVTVRANMKANSVAFEFHRRQTVLKAPIGCWIEMPFAVGDIDVSAHAYEQPLVLAARLEAMRVASTANPS